MPDRSSKVRKPSKDPNVVASRIVAEATGDSAERQAEPETQKDPAAVELGRRGGLKGGKARAAKLSGEERRAIARKAAQARWKRKDDDR